MRIVWILSLTLLACRQEVPPASRPASQPPVVEETTQPAAPEPAGVETRPARAARSNVLIDVVEVANPIVVIGRARTFENNVALRVRDARGEVLTESFTTATGEMGSFSPFRGTVWITRDPGGRVTVEAFERSAEDGSVQSLVSEARPFAIGTIDARLFFPDPDCTGVREHVRKIPKSVSHARMLVEALIDGPAASESRATNAFPAGSRVESVNLRDGVLTVDFNERLRNVGGACRAQMIRQSVTRTLATLPSVRKVVITAGGSEALALQP